jgi:hypothetical protein
MLVKFSGYFCAKTLMAYWQAGLKTAATAWCATISNIDGLLSVTSVLFTSSAIVVYTNSQVKMILTEQSTKIKIQKHPYLKPTNKDTSSKAQYKGLKT